MALPGSGRAAAVGAVGGEVAQDLLDDAGLGDVHHDTREEVLGVRWRRHTGLVARFHALGVRHRLRALIHLQPLEAHGWAQE